MEAPKAPDSSGQKWCVNIPRETREFDHRLEIEEVGRKQGEKEAAVAGKQGVLARQEGPQAGEECCTSGQEEAGGPPLEVVASKPGGFEHR